MRIKSRNARALLIVLTILLIYAIFSCYKTSIELIERNDGEFEPLKHPLHKKRLTQFFKDNAIKPIDLLFKITKPYTLRVNIEGTERTLTIPVNYVSDGVSRPIRKFKIPNEYEDSYWVYHDFMYQAQTWDDGTAIQKHEADDIMYLLITHNKSAPRWCRMYRLFVNVNNFKIAYWVQLRQRGPCFETEEADGSYTYCFKGNQTRCYTFRGNIQE